MILQSLVAYYTRRAASADDSRRLPSYGLEEKEIPFVIEIDDEGQLVQLRDTRQPDGKRLRAKRFLVPQGEKKTSGVRANLLWDSAEYVVGLGRDRKGSAELSPAQAFRQRIAELPDPAAIDPGIRAVMLALDRADWSVLSASPAWPEIQETNPLMSFARLADAGELVCQRPAVIEAALTPTAAEAEGWCLVEGRHMAIARLHPVIKGVKDAQTSGANIVSFNARAFESYGKTDKQGENAPVSERATFAYTTALNALLARGSPNKIQLGDATTVIWADRDSSLDADLVAVFGDDPDQHVQAVRDRLSALHTGRISADDSGLRFFVLGLAPNASRIAIRFWINEAFDTLAPRILQHFADLRIVNQAEHRSVAPPMFQLLCAVSVLGKADNIAPRLAGEWMRAILEGTSYPPALLNAAVNRCRAEQATQEHGGNVPHLRAAILKACINREYRRRHALATDTHFIREELDMSQMDPAYRLGRLFAVLERIQEQSARPARLNSTIRDRYYGAASSTPASVFPSLLRLKNAHLKKLGPAEAAHFEQRIGDIFGTVEQPSLAGFPRQLDLPAQGLFALGYYQQRQAFFVRKADPLNAAPESAVAATAAHNTSDNPTTDTQER